MINYIYNYLTNIFLFFIFFIIMITPLYADGLCEGENSNINCLFNNFDKLYSENYNIFWDILHKSEKNAIQCKSISNMVNYLNLSNINSKNAEFNEYFSEKIENMCIKNNECFFKALLELNSDNQNKIIDLLVNPTFISHSEITKSFKKNLKFKEYKNIIENYFIKLKIQIQREESSKI